MPFFLNANCEVLLIQSLKSLLTYMGRFSDMFSEMWAWLGIIIILFLICDVFSLAVTEWFSKSVLKTHIKEVLVPTCKKKKKWILDKASSNKINIKESYFTFPAFLPALSKYFFGLFLREPFGRKLVIS